ncbi:nephrin-like [Saccoglossus kowalevskii]
MSDVDVHVPHAITYGLVGYDTTLICVYETDPIDPILTWYDGIAGNIILQEMNGVVIVNPDYQDRFSLTGQASIRINDTELDDSNDYECVVSAGGVTDQGSTYLSVSESQSPVCTIQHNTQPVEGDDLILTCTTEGIPPPTVQWLTDGYVIEESERCIFSEDGTELTILNSHRYDSGEGDQIVIICGASGGNPTPELYWHDNNLKPLEKSCIWNEQQPTYELTISSCTWELESSDNERVYTCTGKSDASSQTYDCDTGQLDVKYSPDSPVCNVREENTFFKEGNEITLICVSLDGNPLATLQWVNTSSGMVMTGTTPEPSDSESIATYSWTLSRADNNIPYVCEATNIVQTDPLTCSSGPLNISFAAMDILLSEPINPYKRGEYITLTCTSGSSNPPSSIEWYRNNTLVMNSEYATVVHTDYIDGEFSGTITQQDLEPFPCQTSLTGYDGHVMAGEELILTCTSCSSNPQAELMWYIDDMEVQDGLSVPRYTHAEYNGMKTSQNLTKSMTYLDHGAVIYYGPIPNTAYAISTANQMEIGNLTCQIDSNPDVNITWYDESHRKLHTTGRTTIIEWRNDTIRTSVLVIYNVTQEDYGNYTCYAENYVNSSIFVIEFTETGMVVLEFVKERIR